MKQTNRVLAILLALLMAFSFTTIAAQAQSVSPNGSGGGTGGGNGDKKLEIASVTVGGADLEGATVKAGDQIVIAFTNGMKDYYTDNMMLISVLKADGTYANCELRANDDPTNENAKREYIITLGENDGGELTLVIGADVKANNGNTLGKEARYSFTFEAPETVEPVVEPAQPTFLERVKLFFVNLFEKIGAFLANITGGIPSWIFKLKSYFGGLFA